MDIISRYDSNIDYTDNIIATEFSGIKYVLYFNKSLPKSIIEKIHNKIFI